MRRTWLILLFLLLAATSQSVLVAPAPPLPTYAVNLVWNPSNDPSVIAYWLLWGTASRAYTGAVCVAGGSTTNGTVRGLAYNVLYYFTGIASNGVGMVSPYANEIAWETNGPPGTTFNLSLR
jgi:hypothetical protein